MFRLFEKGHLSRGCRVRDRCSQCGGRHHISICILPRSGEREKEQSAKEPSSTPLNVKAPTFKVPSLLSGSNGTILLQTARTNAYDPEDPERKVSVRLIFDSGSQRSYITERVSNQLGLRALGIKEMSIATFGAGNGIRHNCEVVKVALETREGEHVEVTLLTIPLICEPLVSNSPDSYISRCDYIRTQDLADPVVEGEVNVDILVGLDHYWDLVTGETVRVNEGPTAVYSKLGWLLSGPLSSSSRALVTHVLTACAKTYQEKKGLEAQLKEFWELEAIGIKENDDTLYDQFKENVEFNGDRYEVALPWRDHVFSIPNNYELSLKRLKGLLRRLKHQPALFREYDKYIRDQVEGGIVEIVEEPNHTDGDKVHYLPHHAVIRQDKQTTKLRVVYDGSARSVGPSLNECLHVGPKFNQHIVEILVRFRLYKNSFIADIEKAFSYG